jgi:hypothetical protein
MKPAESGVIDAAMAALAPALMVPMPNVDAGIDVDAVVATRREAPRDRGRARDTHAL